MDAYEVRKYKKLLLEKRQQLQTFNIGESSVIPGAGGLEADPVDQANADTEAELQIQLYKSDSKLLRAIDEALSRITHGSFGRCEGCKQPISKARLEAVPWARHCRHCKEREHSAA